MKYRVKITGFKFGVPMGFLGYKYNAEQFKIIGLFCDKRCDADSFIQGTPVELDASHKAYVGGVVNNKAVYARVLIKFR